MTLWRRDLMYDFFSKRPPEIEKQIVDNWEPSKVHHDVFSKDETKKLINIFKKAPKAGAGLTFYKMFDDCLESDNFENTYTRPKFGEQSTACSAPVCWEESKEILDPVLRKCIGDYKMIGGKFNLTLGPYRLHTDSGRYPESKIFKQIIIPLHWNETLPVYSMLFKQRWTGCQARFQRGVYDAADFEKFETPTHMTVIDYENSDIHNLTNKPFDEDDYKKYLTHINYESLWGFSIELPAMWDSQCLIAYDRSVIHSSCHFAEKNLKNKLFLTLVTEQPDDK